jgi:phosphatidylglycerophosphate synthase
MITEKGKAFDPLADKILDLPILLFLAFISGNLFIIISAITILVCDIIGQCLRGISTEKAANWQGKTKTTIKIVCIYILSLDRYDLDIHTLSEILIAIAVLFSVWSMLSKTKLLR